MKLFDTLGHYKFWKFISFNFVEKLLKSGTISDFVAFFLSSYFLLWHGQKRNYQKRNEKGKKKFSHIFDKQFMKLHFNCHSSKGQLISKGVLMSLLSSKKRTKEFNFTTMIPQIDLFSFVFGGNRRHQKTISKLSDLYHKVYGRESDCSQIMVDYLSQFAPPLRAFYSCSGVSWHP